MKKSVTFYEIIPTGIKLSYFHVFFNVWIFTYDKVVPIT